MAINPVYHILDEASPGIWSDDFELNRYDHLITIGQVENHLYFIKEGAVRVYFSSAETDQTIRLGYQGNILNALPSFLTNEPSTIAIEVLKRSVFQRADKQAVFHLLESSTAFQQVWNKLLEELFLTQFDREIDILTSSPEERYHRVLKRSPQLFQEIPAKYIADYLRMSPETLSRLKKS